MAGNKSKSKDFSKNPALDFFSKVKIERDEVKEKEDFDKEQEVSNKEDCRKRKKELLMKIVSMKPDENNLLSQDELDKLGAIDTLSQEETFHDVAVDDVSEDLEDDDFDENYNHFFNTGMYSKFSDNNTERETGKGRKIDPKENRDRRFSLSLTKSLYEQANEQAYQNRQSLTTFIIQAIENELKRCKKNNKK